MADTTQNLAPSAEPTAQPDSADNTTASPSITEIEPKSDSKTEPTAEVAPATTKITTQMDETDAKLDQVANADRSADVPDADVAAAPAAQAPPADGHDLMDVDATATQQGDPKGLVDASKPADIPVAGEDAMALDSYPSQMRTETSAERTTSTNEQQNAEPADDKDGDAPHVTDALSAILGLLPEEDEAKPPATEDQTAQDHPMGQEPEKSVIAEVKTDDVNNGLPKDGIIMPAAAEQADVTMGQAPDEEGGAEWEADSSPYESSSDSSEDSSDDDSDDAEMLSVQETAKLLMAQMDGSDDEEDGKKGKGPSAAQVKTKNEQVEAPPPKPDITLSEPDEIVLLGEVLHVVDNSLVVKGNTDGKYQVLDNDSALCKADRTIIGVVSDVIGNVQSPMYIVRFASAEEITNEGLQPGAQVYYPPAHSKFVFTEALQAIKGSDASNLHDEEVAANEAEFSDDEKEQAYKKELKNKRRGAKGQPRDGETDNRPVSSYTRNEPTPSESASVLNYDDEDDGPYKPLARPANFGQGLPPIPPAPAGGFPSRGRGDFGQRGRGDFRGNRGNRGRGDRRGGRDGGRGGRPEGYSQPPQNRSHQASPPQHHTPPFPTPANGAPPASGPNPYQWAPFQTPTPPTLGQSLPFPPPPPPPPGAGGMNMQQFTAWAQSTAAQQQQIHQQIQHQMQQQQQAPAPQHQHAHQPPPPPQYQQPHIPSAYNPYPPQPHQPQPPTPYGQQQAGAPAWTPPPPPQTPGYNPAGYYGAQGQHAGWNPNQQNSRG